MLLPPSLNPTAPRDLISVPDHRLKGSQAPSGLACQDGREYYPLKVWTPNYTSSCLCQIRWPAPRLRVGSLSLEAFPVSYNLEGLNSKAIAYSEILTASIQPLSQAQASVSMATADAGSRTATLGQCSAPAPVG